MERDVALDSKEGMMKQTYEVRLETGCPMIVQAENKDAAKKFAERVSRQLTGSEKKAVSASRIFLTLGIDWAAPV